jgi:diaminohydroxyphosphoribosylaminopyrimidine deaminase/5-amino-6-(5-phosphoribosylamino)uracil reductase
MEQGVDRTRIDLRKQPETGQIARAFARALDLAQLHEGATAPNPPVGCVLLDSSGAEIAAGAHRRAGTQHAEIHALAAARESGLFDRIHTVVVTLEPCNHHGRTPPCSEAILASSAQQVVIACRDPNPRAVGGAERLVQEGRTVHFLSEMSHPEAPGLMARAERLLAPFAKHVRTGLPFVTIKQAISAAGSMIPEPGRKTFTSAASLVLAHRLRRRADAILTGSGTVLADDPHFTVRHVPDHEGRQRLLVILDRRRAVSPHYQSAARQRGFDVLIADDPASALTGIGASGAMEALVEAGPSVTASMLDAGLWDEHVLIEQAAGAGNEDRVTVRRNPAFSLDSQGKGTDVLRHY